MFERIQDTCGSQKGYKKLRIEFNNPPPIICYLGNYFIKSQNAIKIIKKL